MTESTYKNKRNEKRGGQMKPQTIVKIDICKSKEFTKKTEKEDPQIRKVLLEKLKEISQETFPYSNKKYPKGSFYKSEGDAVYYILEKPTVAIRSSIEFMKEWFYRGIQEAFPESKIILHRGSIDPVEVPDGEDVVGKVFDDISVIEKTLDGGNIYVTQSVRDHADITISKFIVYGKIKINEDESINVYRIAFCDPRTFENDSLAHMLFVAHKGATKEREKIFKFIIIEYLMEKGTLSESDFNNFENWSRSKGYSVLPRAQLKKLFSDKDLFITEVREKDLMCKLRQEIIEKIKEAQDQYDKAVEEAVQLVKEKIIQDIGTEEAIKGLDIKNIMDEYLCGVFSEIRMMANYFNNTAHFYDSDTKIFSRYDYIIERHLGDLKDDIKKKWKDSFVKGLMKVTQQENVYISGIFFNILAGYYMNREFHSSLYQLEKLQKRRLFLDTNVLYALRCSASNYNSQVNYFAERLEKINLPLLIFPFTLEEYETHLKIVESEYRKNPYSEYLLNWNPWLNQEFRSNPMKYLNDIGVCRLLNSFAKDKPITEEHLKEIEEELSNMNISLELEYEEYSEEEKSELWDKLRLIILKRTGIEEYWDLSYRLTEQKETIIEHDVNLVENVNKIHKENGSDELGPKVLLLTLDTKKLLKCRKEYPFIINTEQFLEFILPYLFLADIPAEDPNRFPNKILSAQLAIYSLIWKPESFEYIAIARNNPEALKMEGSLGPNSSVIAEMLSGQRYISITTKKEPQLVDDDIKKISQIAEEVDEIIRLKDEIEFLKRKSKDDEEERGFLKQRIDKLRRTLKYYKRVKK